VVGDASMRVKADRDACIGAGMCVMTADAVFDQDEDGIVLVVAEDISADELEQRRVYRAVRQCPSGALYIAQE
jgi:ferredoxin